MTTAPAGGLGSTLPLDPTAGLPVTLVTPTDPAAGLPLTTTTPLDPTAGLPVTTTTPADPSASAPLSTLFPVVQQSGNVLLKQSAGVTVQQAQPGWTLAGRVGDAAALRDQLGTAATGNLKYSAWTGAVHLPTGDIAVGCSGTLAGAHEGQCAEPNIIAVTHWNPADVLFIRAMRLEDIKDGFGKMWQEKEICPQCQRRYPPDNFVDGVLSNEDGDWNR
jgi:hypothetical protein